MSWMVDEKFVCPNGHEAPRLHPRICDRCNSAVTYVPQAIEMQWAHNAPIVQVIITALEGRGWSYDSDGGVFRHPSWPGEGFLMGSAVTAQIDLELREVAAEIKQEFGFEGNG